MLNSASQNSQCIFSHAEHRSRASSTKGISNLSLWNSQPAKKQSTIRDVPELQDFVLLPLSDDLILVSGGVCPDPLSHRNQGTAPNVVAGHLSIASLVVLVSFSNNRVVTTA
jgi:hypothetical protein